MKNEYERITSLKGIKEGQDLMEGNAENYRKEYILMREQEYIDKKWKMEESWKRDIAKVKIDANVKNTKKGRKGKKGKGKGNG